ncbi:MAG: TIR domain-containing protein [Bacteroidales bacterium]|nr:TIR domain-containing protein [Bacteroidales bacterium]
MTEFRNNSEMDEYKRYAFISYNHRDVKWAHWVRKNLENFKLPKGVENEFIESKYLRPIFRDQDDLNSGILNDELQKHLATSKFLIVICSPYSAKSEWVSNEVQYFIDHGRLQNIIPFIVAGDPTSDGENACFPCSLRTLFKENPNQELLGVNVQEVGKRKSMVRIVSRILGVDFDRLWNRYERERRSKLSKVAIAMVVAAIVAAFFVVPVQMSVKISEPQHSLPMPERMILTVDGIEYPLYSSDTVVQLNSLPGYCRGQSVPMSFSAYYYNTIETKLSLPFFWRKTVEIQLQRDSTFAIYAGVVVDESGNPLADVSVTCETCKTTTNSDGKFYIAIPLENQSLEKNIVLQKEGYITGGREDESPSKYLYYLLRK